MSNTLISTEHEVRFATAIYRGDRVHLVIEPLPGSDECDWLVWRHDSSSVRRSRKRLPVSKAMVEAEQAAKSMLTSGVRLYWREPETPRSSEVIQLTDDFKIAAERAREIFPNGLWERMSINQQADAIYAELRALDLNRRSVTTENAES